MQYHRCRVGYAGVNVNPCPPPSPLRWNIDAGIQAEAEWHRGFIIILSDSCMYGMMYVSRPSLLSVEEF